MDLSQAKFKSSTRHDESEIVEFRGTRQVNLEQIERELFGDSNITPLGQLLEMIGSLPEIRQEKVFSGECLTDFDYLSNCAQKIFYFEWL